MTQREFIDKLNMCLSGKVSTGTVQENISYYEQYFASEISSGKSEASVCESLGSPQLIAKSILEAEKFQSDNGASDDYTGQVHEEMDYRSTGTRWSEGVRSFHMPAWLIMMVAVFLFFSVISLVLSVFSIFAPIIIPICIVLFVLQIFKNNFR